MQLLLPVVLLLFIAHTNAFPPFSSLMRRIFDDQNEAQPRYIRIIDENGQPQQSVSTLQLPDIYPAPPSDDANSSNKPNNAFGEEEEDEDPCPVCLESLKSPSDGAVFVDIFGRRVCGHWCCKRCAGRMMITKYYESGLTEDQRLEFRCMQCRRHFDAAMPIRAEAVNYVFAVFDVNNDGWVDKREFEMGVRTMRLERFLTAQQIEDAFLSFATRRPASGGQFMISRKQFAQLWKVWKGDYSMWICKPATISDEEAMQVPPEMMGMFRDHAADNNEQQVVQTGSADLNSLQRLQQSPCCCFWCVACPAGCAATVCGIETAIHVAFGGYHATTALPIALCYLFGCVNLLCLSRSNLAE